MLDVKLDIRYHLNKCILTYKPCEKKTESYSLIKYDMCLPHLDDSNRKD